VNGNSTSSNIVILLISIALAIVVYSAADRETSQDDDAVSPTVYKSIKLHGRTYNFFVVEIDGEEYVVGSCETHMTMVRKGEFDGRHGPGPGNSPLLPEGR
jgi:hypothetical protein